MKIQPLAIPHCVLTDGDKLPDGWKLQYGLSPCECAATNSPAWDADNDGLGLLDEYRYCTSPLNPDTDGDGVRDGVEVPHSPGSCPTDASDGGSSTNCVTLSFTVGDSSGSESERWNLEVFEQAQCFGTQWSGWRRFGMRQLVERWPNGPIHHSPG